MLRPSLTQRLALILVPNNFVIVSISVLGTCWNAEFSFLDDNSFDGSQSFGGGNGHSLFADSDDEGGGAAFYHQYPLACACRPSAFSNMGSRQTTD